MDKQLLINRVKSFAWRLGAMVVVALLSFVLANLGILGISPDLQIVLGLILGEVTKAINVWLSK